MQEFYSSILDVLTPDDVRILVETEDEFARRGQFERIFPSRISMRYLRFFEQPRYFNILTTQWELKYFLNKTKGKQTDADNLLKVRLSGVGSVIIALIMILVISSHIRSQSSQAQHHLCHFPKLYHCPHYRL